MNSSKLESLAFTKAVIDALSSHICVTDRSSVIIMVNRAWRNFASANSAGSTQTYVGTCYLDVCGEAAGPDAEDARNFVDGMKAVLEGKTDLFHMEYSCHSPSENRWFLGRVTPLLFPDGGLVISHLDITDRRVMELEVAKMAATDSLTGLPNRRNFLEAATRELERVRRFGGPASLVMMDLDHFKVVNDTYGHAVGDEALRVAAQACRSVLRQIDIMARVGGEEFVLVLPGTDEAGAANVAEKLRQSVATTPVDGPATSFFLSASFGVAEVRQSDGRVDEALARADAALYVAKGAGRNCVRRFSSAPDAPHLK